MANVTQINTYPIKSCAGLRHTSVTIEPRGMVGDRRWMIIDSEGRFITGRQHPSLVRLHAEQTDAGLRLSAPGRPDIDVAVPSGPSRAVQIWRDHTTAAEADAEASAWVSSFLGADVSLVYQGDDDRRDLSQVVGGQEGDHVNFADGYPVLLIGSASLADLNKRLAAPAAMERFRTNLVANTSEAFVEDRWARIRIGECEFDVAKRCSRCVFTTVDPLSGEKDPAGEPFKTLRTYRLDKAARGVMFGVNLIPRRLGRVELGQSIEVLSEVDA